MKIKYLGTAAAEGIPGMFCSCDFCQKVRLKKGKNIRTRSGAILGSKILIDYSPDINFNSLRFDINLSKITDIVVTHTHIDHFATSEIPMMDSDSYCKNTRQGEITIYTTKNGMNMAKKAIMDDLYKENIGVKFHIWEKFSTAIIDDYHITPLPAVHGDEKEPCYILLIQQGDKSFLYGNDTAIFANETLKYLEKIQLNGVAMDCTFGNEKHSQDTHMGFADNIKLRDILKEQGTISDETKLFITHFSHDCNMLHEEMVEMAKPYGFDVVYDGMEIEI